MKVPIFDLRVKDSDLKKDLIETFTKVIEKGRLFMGEEVEEFEDEVSKFVGKKFALGVSSGSSAIFLALKACGIEKDDEVIISPLTWIIPVNAIASCGAKPIFTDVREDFNLDPYSIESKITSKTKAILAMHYAGHMCDMEIICKIAEKHNLIVIEDAAQAFGAKLNNKSSGSFSLAAGFSMNPMKFFGGYGEAGVVVTDNENIYQRLKRLRHAGTTSDYKKIITNNCLEVSLNHKIDTIKAALLLVMMKRLPAKRVKAEQIASRLKNELHSDIKHQEIFDDEIHGRYAYPIIYHKRDKLIDYLNSKQIETKIFNFPLAYDAPIYQKYKIAKLPIAEKMIANSLIIPSHDKLSNDQVNYLIENINDFFV